MAQLNTHMHDVITTSALHVQCRVCMMHGGGVRTLTRRSAADRWPSDPRE
jgi:hypothetical protein